MPANDLIDKKRRQFSLPLFRLQTTKVKYLQKVPILIIKVMNLPAYSNPIDGTVFVGVVPTFPSSLDKDIK